MGITAVGHKVIRKLLDEVVKAAREMNVAGVTCAHRKEDADPETARFVRSVRMTKPCKTCRAAP